MPMILAHWLVANDPEISTDRLAILARPTHAVHQPVPGRTSYWALQTWT